MAQLIFRILAAALALTASTALATPTLEQIRELPIPEANQGVGVDDKYFYAVDNQTIGKYDKQAGKLYAAQSNYPEWPMTSSLEIFIIRATPAEKAAGGQHKVTVFRLTDK